MDEKKSRVKKYEELRKTLIEEAQEKGVFTKELTPFAKQLYQIDNDHFDHVEEDHPTDYHSPLHMRNNRYNSEDDFDNINEESFDEEENFPSEEENNDVNIIDEFSEEDFVTNSSLNQETDSFNNQYLNEFIQEVKDYNIQKGYRGEEDTKSNLLNEVMSSRKLRPFNVVSTPDKEIEIEEVEEQEEILETIAPVIESTKTLDDTQKFEPIIEETKPIGDEEIDQTIMMKVQELAETEPTYEDMLDDEDHRSLLEETTKLKVQLESQKDKVTQMSSKIEKTNKLMNIVIMVLLFLVILLFLIVIYNILKIKKVI